jgi:hypothetical protein
MPISPTLAPRVPVIGAVRAANYRSGTKAGKIPGNEKIIPQDGALGAFGARPASSSQIAVFNPDGTFYKGFR